MDNNVVTSSIVNPSASSDDSALTPAPAITGSVDNAALANAEVTEEKSDEAVSGNIKEMVSDTEPHTRMVSEEKELTDLEKILAAESAKKLRIEGASENLNTSTMSSEDVKQRLPENPF